MAAATFDPFEQTELRPYWHATMPTLPDRRDRPLPEKVDVVVIGGGYTGLSCARTLALAGARVTVLEAESLGWGASTRNGGIVHPGYKWGPSELQARHGEELGRLLWAETLDGWAFLCRLIEEERIDAGLAVTGHVELAVAPSHVRGLGEERESLAAMGTPAEVLPPQRIREELGSDAFGGALVIGGSGSVHPGRLFAGLVDAAERAGAELHEGVRAWLISAAPGGGHIVHTMRGPIVADQVVVATNGYTDGVVPALRRRIIPIGSYIIATEPLPAELVHELSPKGRPFFDTWNFLHYWQVRDGRMIFGGRASFRPTSFARAARILHRGLLEIHPQLADLSDRLRLGRQGRLHLGSDAARGPPSERRRLRDGLFGDGCRDVALPRPSPRRMDRWRRGSGPVASDIPPRADPLRGPPLVPPVRRRVVPPERSPRRPLPIQD